MDRRRMLQASTHEADSKPWREYIQDGLIFQLDCDYECTSEQWIDVVSNVVYTGNGIDLDNGVPVFKGADGHYLGTENIYFTWEGKTIEIAYKPFSFYWGHNILFRTGVKDTLAVIFHSVSHTELAFCLSNSAYKPVYDVDKADIVNAFNTTSHNNLSCFNNARKLTSPYNNGWSTPTLESFVGKSFNGKIYAIRIYDRKITEEEMLYNQNIDLKRFENR